MAYRGYESYMGAYGMPAAPYGFPAAAPLAVPPYQAPMGGYGGADELRTVFITGFPNDIKERELNNLLRFIPGYEASQMNWKNGQARKQHYHELQRAAPAAARNISPSPYPCCC